MDLHYNFPNREEIEVLKESKLLSQVIWSGSMPHFVIPRQVVVEVGRALLTICPATLVEEKKTVRKAPASSQGSFLLLYYPIFGFFCLVILFLCLSNFTNTVFVEFLTNKHF